ncbi:hypothetical protein AGMMS49992_09840 [Clostridia bacterium]|nr:hypothetical protein AGMMS49992_09840 [Clostridia bacterium]
MRWGEFNLEEYGEVRFEDGVDDYRRKTIKHAISIGYDDASIAVLVDAPIKEVREIRQELLMTVK